MPHRYFTTEIADGHAVLRGQCPPPGHAGKNGDTVILCDGRTTEYTGTVAGFGEDLVELSVDRDIPARPSRRWS